MSGTEVKSVYLCFKWFEGESDIPEALERKDLNLQIFDLINC